MTALAWTAAGAAFLLSLLLLIKILVMRKSAREIEEAFHDRLMSDTNTLIDISSRDRRMRSLAESVNRELRVLRAERLRFLRGDEELKSAVTNISHDLRTPLTAICGYLDLLNRVEKSDAVARYLDVIRGRAEFMTGLTEELFRYSVILSGVAGDEPEPVSVNAVLEECVAAGYAALTSRGIEPAVSLPERKVVRTLDRAALVRVFSNLISNAAKYSAGDLDIVLTEGGEVTFSNSAPRLDEVQVGRLFDRFYTVDTARSSTGLGLSIARTLMRRMGGGISAEYAGGRLTVRVALPEE